MLILIAIIFCVIISAKNSKKVDEKQYNLVQNVSTNRYLDYYHYNYMEDENAGMDIRIYSQKQLIINEVIDKGRLPWMKVLLGKYSLYQKYYGINILISTLVGGFAYIYLGLLSLAGYISLGSVTKSIASITMLFNTLNQIFVTLSQIKNNNKYLRSFYEFIDVPSKEHTGSQILGRSIDHWEVEFHNVSFRYPNSQEYAVKNVSIKISSKDRVAVVGMNGSGKTNHDKISL